MFTYNTHDDADWLEYTIRLGLPWHANYSLGKQETCLQEKKETRLESRWNKVSHSQNRHPCGLTNL